MKLAIVGSRTFNDYDMLVDFIKKNYDIGEITHIVSGGAKGAFRYFLNLLHIYNI